MWCFFPTCPPHHLLVLSYSISWKKNTVLQDPPLGEVPEWVSWARAWRRETALLGQLAHSQDADLCQSPAKGLRPARANSSGHFFALWSIYIFLKKNNFTKNDGTNCHEPPPPFEGFLILLFLGFWCAIRVGEDCRVEEAWTTRKAQKGENPEP